MTAPSGQPDLSLVIPAYNEERRLGPTLEAVLAFLGDQPYTSEVIVVSDGSRDGTRRVAEAAFAALDQSPAAKVTGRFVEYHPNAGKGRAVRTGVAHTTGRFVAFTDADLSTPIEELPRLVEKMDAGYDVVIGSRALPGSRIEVHQPWYRENMGRLYNLFVRALALPGLRDTQCGFKLWSAAAADDAFAAARLDGFTFDVEALYVARKRGYRIAEMPVTWRNDAATRVGLGGGSRAFPDLLKIRWYDWRGRYEAGGEL